MTPLLLEPDDIIVGIDTHKDNHVGFAINSLGARLDDCLVPATTAGYEQLLDWARALGPIAAVGVEGTGSYGIGLTHFLRRQGIGVVEVSRPCRRASRRLQGKNDVLDAQLAAQQVLSGEARVIPKASDGLVEMMRLIKVARDTAVKAKTQTLVTLKATLVTAEENLRQLLEPLSTPELIAACTQLEVCKLSTPAAAMRHTLSTMAKR